MRTTDPLIVPGIFILWPVNWPAVLLAKKDGLWKITSIVNEGHFLPERNLRMSRNGSFNSGRPG